MLHLAGKRAIAPLVVVALAVTGALGAAPAAAQDDNFTCRASLIRTENFPVVGPVNPNIEPTVANAKNNPCETDTAGLLAPVLGEDNTITAGPVTAKLLFANTTNNDNAAPPAKQNASAESGVAVVDIAIPGAPPIRAEILTANAMASCETGTNPPTLTSGSTVARLFINGTEPLAPVTNPLNGAQTVPLGPLGNIFLNQTTKTPNSITQRALVVDTILGDVIVAEAIADFRGNPCDDGTKPPPPGKEICGNGVDDDGDGQIDEDCPPPPPGGGGDGPPQCSDEIDNDGDGFVDFPNDPGCESYQDDDERDDGPDAPDCSNGVDDDGDGQIDYPEDPGCENRDDPDEENNDDPECSDGDDNDGDGTSDSGDSGCKSPEDDDEAAGFMNGGGGYDEVDKKTANEDYVEPGTFLRYGTVLPCDLGDKPGPNQTVTWHDPGLQGRFKLDTLTRAFCRNDPFIDPGAPRAEFDTYVGDGTGTFTNALGLSVPVSARFHVIDRGEPGSPPVIGVDYFHIRTGPAALFAGPGLPPTAPPFLAVGFGTLDHGNNQAHTPPGATR